jgi:hypothetical protein
MTTLTEYGRRLTEQARPLHVHPNTLNRWVRHHGLKATFLAGRWHILDSDLYAFFAERTTRRLKRPAPIDERAHDLADKLLNESGW